MHAVTTFPEECCGVLLGVVDGPAGPDGSNGPAERADVHVHRILPARNEHPDRRETRFLISPETVLAARREARELGIDVVGYYHSHTDGGAEPSGHDLKDAWPATSYVIVPVAEGRAGEPRSWRLGETHEGFVEETLVCPGDGSPGSPSSVGDPLREGDEVLA